MSDSDRFEAFVRSYQHMVFGVAVRLLGDPAEAEDVLPVLGIIAWTTLGVFGLGAVATVFAAGLRRENPAPPEPVPAPIRTPVPDVVGPEERADRVPPVPETGVDLTAFPRAGFLLRLAAFALDVALIGIVTAFLNLDEGQFVALLLVYHMVFWGWKGTTVGGIICQLRLVRVNGEALRLSDALVRGLASIFSIVVVGLGCLWILRDPERQAWHDKIAGTYVVQVPKNWPLP